MENSSLPDCRTDLNPNLVTVYRDAQNDYLEGRRVYLLGALVVAHQHGEPTGRRSIVRMTEGPPDTIGKERKLFIDWTRELLHAVVELAVSDAPDDQPKSAPRHFPPQSTRRTLDALDPTALLADSAWMPIISVSRPCRDGSWFSRHVGRHPTSAQP
ncbi:MAG: hypothetical protein K2X38_12690 [Gemmataceae bacterium]|nr:hypothetical protein [Gemmataceae bacterium]